MKKTLWILAALLVFAPAGAQEKDDAVPFDEAPVQRQQRTSRGNAGPKVLDFDADVIEGERKSPNLFLQMQVETPNLDSLLFQRSNFNDFHDLEKQRRPVYRKLGK